MIGPQLCLYPGKCEFNSLLLWIHFASEDKASSLKGFKSFESRLALLYEADENADTNQNGSVDVVFQTMFSMKELKIIDKST